MGYAKERKKLEKLTEKITALQNFDAKALAIITDMYDQYSHTARILKNKDTESFNDLYLNELQQVKTAKRLMNVAEEAENRAENFVKYKAVLLDAIAKTIKATNDIA